MGIFCGFRAAIPFSQSRKDMPPNTFDRSLRDASNEPPPIQFAPRVWRGGAPKVRILGQNSHGPLSAGRRPIETGSVSSESQTGRAQKAREKPGHRGRHVCRGASPPGSQKFEITFPHPTRAPETIRYGRKHRRPASPRRRGQIRKGSRETEVWKKNFFSILQLDAAVKYRWNVRPIGVRGNDAAVERMQTFQTARENTHKRPSSEQKRELTHTERRYAWSA